MSGEESGGAAPRGPHVNRTGPVSRNGSCTLIGRLVQMWPTHTHTHTCCLPQLNQLDAFKPISRRPASLLRCPWRPRGRTAASVDHEWDGAGGRRGRRGGGEVWGESGLWSIRSVTQRLTSCQGLAAWLPASAQWPAFTPTASPPPPLLSPPHHPQFPPLFFLKPLHPPPPPPPPVPRCSTSFSINCGGIERQVLQRDSD